MTAPSTPAHALSHVDVQKFQGGKSWMTRAGGLGLVGLLATFVGMAITPAASFPAYLIAFAYWAGIGFSSLILLMTTHAFRAKWTVVIRRPLETMAVSILPLLILALPILLGGMSRLYLWVSPQHELLTREANELLKHKAPYLNVTFFFVRTLGYFAIAIFVSNRLFGLSTKQDASGDPQLTQRQRNTGVAFLPLMALVITFAGFDWLMSLDPLWFSTIFGVYFFAGSVMSTIAILILVTSRAQGKDNFGPYVSADHLHNLGKLLFAFTCFWAYIAVSQFLLIWIAGLPEEAPFFLLRMNPTWAPVSIFLILGHFVLPFAVMLSRNLKRNLGRIKIVAGYALLIHFVDVYWLVMPTFHSDSLGFHWSHVSAFLGVGGVAVAYAIWRIRGHFTVPVKDPYLGVSLRYRQP